MKGSTAQAVLVVVAAELMLARTLGQPLSPGEVLVASGAWLGLAALVGRFDARWASAAPLIVIVGLLPLYRAGGPADAGLVAWVASAGLVGLAAVARPRPVLLVGVLALAVLTTLLTVGSGPPVAALVTLGIAWAALLRIRDARIGFVLALAATQVPESVYSARPVRWAADAPVSDGPDIVLIVVDTLRGDAGRRMVSYRRLAAEGRAFERVMAAGPWTLPSMATLHTGLPVGAHGAGAAPGGVTTAIADVPTLAEQLAASGYDTAAVVANNPYVGRAYGFERGFQRWDHAGEPSLGLPANPAVEGAHPTPILVLHTIAGLLDARLPLGATGSGAEALVDRALQVLDARRDRPLLLWLHLLDPHLPYEATPELAGLTVAELRADPRWRTSEGLALLQAAYAREVEATDRALVRFLDGLGPEPPGGRIVVLTSDHGEELFDHGGFEHGHTLYEELLDVPLVIAGAEVTRGTERSLVSHADLAPSLLAAAGLPSGRDLRRPVADQPAVAGDLLGGGAGGAVRDRDHKLIALPDGERVYDLAADPSERRPAASVDGALRALLPDATRHGPPAAHADADVGALEALGYLER